MTKATECNFEKALQRLEEILETMHSGTISLDDSLKFYEEADTLLTTCNKRLTEAEKKIEILIKKRNGELETDETNTPKTEEFTKR